MENLVDNLTYSAGWTIVHSMWQGILIYTGLLIFLNRVSNLSSHAKFVSAMLAQSMIFICSVGTFAHCYTNFIDLRTASGFSTYGLITSDFREVWKWQDLLSGNFISSIALAYFIGLVFNLMSLAISFAYVRKLKKNTFFPSPDVEVVLNNLIKKLGLSKPVRLLFSAIAETPQTVGVMKPVIFLPLSLVTQLSPTQLELILAHELCHIRRQDYLLNSIKLIFETLLFFNPFIWFCSRIINEERENACDDLVLELNKCPISYAETLFQLEKVKVYKTGLALAFTGEKKHDLLTRIIRITTMKSKTYTFNSHFFKALLIVIMIAGISWAPKLTLTKAEKELHADVETQSASRRNVAKVTHRMSPVVKANHLAKNALDTGKLNLKKYEEIKKLPYAKQLELLRKKNLGFTLTDTNYYKTLREAGYRFISVEGGVAKTLPDRTSKKTPQTQTDLGTASPEVTVVHPSLLNSQEVAAGKLTLAEFNKDREGYIKRYNAALKELDAKIVQKVFQNAENKKLLQEIIDKPRVFIVDKNGESVANDEVVYRFPEGMLKRSQIPQHMSQK